MSQVNGLTSVSPDPNVTKHDATTTTTTTTTTIHHRPLPARALGRRRRSSSTLDVNATPSSVSPPSDATPSDSADVGPPDNGWADRSSPVPWSSAVGRATTGKSGRVIERIQAENDRLRRELKLEILRRDEEQRKSETARGQLHSLQTSNDHLVLMREQDGVRLARKERTIDDLRADLDRERARRHEADGQLRQATSVHEAMQRELHGQLKEASETAQRALGQYNVLSSSWTHMNEGYRRKVDTLRNDLARLRADATEDRRKLNRLGIVVDQQRQEMEMMKVANDAVVATFETFRRDLDHRTDGIDGIRQRAQLNEKALDDLLQEALEVLAEMRHVVHLKTKDGSDDE